MVNDIGASLSGEGGEAGPAEAVVVEIEQTGGEALAHTRSIAEPEGALSLIEETIGRFGRIDGVVNNAGILRDKIFHRMQPEDWEAVIRVHLMGSFYVSRAAAPYFREQGSGAFVHFTSTSGLIGNLGQANYAAAKLGIAGLSRSIALDMQRFGVRSNWRGSLRLEPDDRLDPHRHARAGGPRGQAPADDPGQDRAAGRPSADATRLMTSAARSSACATTRSSSSPSPAPPAPCIGVKAGRHRVSPSTTMPATEGGFHAAGSLRRRVFLGPGLNRRETLKPRSSS